MNTEVIQPNKMAFPQYDDVEAMMKSFKKHAKGPRLLMAFDIKAAHRLVPKGLGLASLPAGGRTGGLCEHQGNLWCCVGGILVGESCGDYLPDVP